jgi:hypothetical protein
MKRLLILVVLLLAAGAAQAQDVTEADAIAVAVAHPAFAGWLDYYPDWHAAAYDTENTYGIWRVQFWGADNADLGWADVNPAREQVYTWETYFSLNDEVQAAAEPVIREFIVAHPRVLELIESPEQYDIYLEYDGTSGFWGVYLDRGMDSLYLLIDFEDDLALTEPRLVRLFFANVVSYKEWAEGNQAKAAATAFAHPDIAAVVRDVEGWTTTAWRVEGTLWAVTFLDGDQPLAEATVDVEANRVIDYHIG